MKLSNNFKVHTASMQATLDEITHILTKSTVKVRVSSGGGGEASFPPPPPPKKKEGRRERRREREREGGGGEGGRGRSGINVVQY